MTPDANDPGQLSNSTLDTEEIRQARVDLAACFRMAARLGLHEGICNHFSFMVPGRDDLFLVNPDGYSFNEITASRLLICDFDGNVIEGDGSPEDTAFYIHARLHMRHPTARAAFHTHMPYATALSMLEGEPLVWAGQSALKFYGRTINDEDYNGLALDTDEGDRIADATCTTLITCNGNHRGAKPVEMKTIADEAMEIAEKQMGVAIETCIVVERIKDSEGVEHEMKDGRDLWYADVMANASPFNEAESMESEDPLFILYTSGSTGKPKGVQHSTGGYMVYASQTHKYVFDYQDGDIYFCTADIGWVTGHSYIIYGPLANGATTIMFEGIPTYPSPDRFWQIVEKWEVNQFYTAPTAIRAIAALGDNYPDKYEMPSLKLLGSVGEPINPEAWRWYNTHVGKGRCPIVDTWWQTETGGILITPFPGAVPTKPGAASMPFFGVEPEILDPENGTPLEGNGVSGVLALKSAWPGQMRTLYGDHKRFEQTYFDTYKGYYFTGDGSTRDKDGYYWVTGRVDDVINVSGHRMGTAEVESALVLHESVAEAAVIGFPHDIKGQGIYAYVTLNVGQEYTEELKQILRGQVRQVIGPIASPDVIHWAPALPKTRSGKIMRRILRKIATDELDTIGDTSTLAEPEVVDELIANKGK